MEGNPQTPAQQAQQQIAAVAGDVKKESSTLIDLKQLPANREVGETLKTVPLLSKLSDEERAKLGGALIEVKFPDGATVIKQGDPGDQFFIIVEGKARVTRVDDATKADQFLGELVAGDYFGETALLEGDVRKATVRAVGPLTCFCMGRSKFVALFGKSKILNVQFAKRGAISAEQVGKRNVKHSIDVVRKMDVDRRKDANQRELISHAVRTAFVFMNLDSEQLKELVDEMFRQEVQSGTVLMEQGQLGDHYYVVEKGLFSVLVKREDGGAAQSVATKGPGSSFGELALMYNSPRSATVVALENSVVWVVHRCVFRHILRQVSSKKFSEYETFLHSVEVLQSLAKYERSRIAEALTEVTFPANHAIFKQGDPGDVFYIIKSGECICTVQNKGEPVKEICKYTSGQYFGERALIKSEPRATTITTVGVVVCLCLSREEFTTLLGPLEEILKGRINQYPTDVGKTQVEKQQDLEKKVMVRPMMKIEKNQLTIIGTLGRGSFGHVQLVKDAQGNVYALKGVNKQQIVELGQQEHILSEKNVLMQLDHPFIIKLFATFKDRDHLYFLVEVCLGGELFRVLRHRNYFDEQTSRFYAAQVVSIFEYLHGRHIIYRDLKPENLMIDSKGYLRMTDFGFAKYVPDRTWTLCGTPDYLAPEVVSGQGHGKGVDWWTLGILIYEMLAGYPPFYDEDHMVTYAKIMKGHVRYPSRFHDDAKDLIRQLLDPKPSHRLGVIKGGAGAVKAHKWFKGFDFNTQLKFGMKAPIIPRIKNQNDLSNFAEDKAKTVDTPYKDDGTNWDADF